jgi:hypothetical protein
MSSTIAKKRRDDYPRTEGPKTCSVCKITKPGAEFDSNRRQRDGLTGKCKVCRTKDDARPANKLSRWKSGCKTRGVLFDLDQDFYTEITKLPCHYCSAPLPTHGIGIDRKDPKGGYTNDNVVPCCAVCNDAKRGFFSYEDMKIVGPAIAEAQRQRALRGEAPLRKNFTNPKAIERWKKEDRAAGRN